MREVLWAQRISVRRVHKVPNAELQFHAWVKTSCGHGQIRQGHRRHTGAVGAQARTQVADSATKDESLASQWYRGSELSQP